MAIPKLFNPAKCLYGNYPNVGKATISQGASGPTVGYLQAVLKCKSAQPLSPSASGPWYFGATTTTAVRNFQSFWGPQTWGVIDWAAKGFPT